MGYFPISSPHLYMYLLMFLVLLGLELMLVLLVVLMFLVLLALELMLVLLVVLM